MIRSSCNDIIKVDPKEIGREDIHTGLDQAQNGVRWWHLMNIIVDPWFFYKRWDFIDSVCHFKLLIKRFDS
jgi:hypothetical protein